MSREIEEIRMSELDLMNDGFWSGVEQRFNRNPDLIQRLKLDGGGGVIYSLTVSMHEELGGPCYFQVEDISSEAFALPFLEYCLEKGEVLPGGIYRLPYVLDETE